MRNIVVLRVASAGLGNLLFQLCSAETVARRTGASVKLDLDGVSGDQLSSPRAGAGVKVLALARLYGFDVEMASAADIWVTRGGWQGRSKLTRLLARTQARLGWQRASYFKEASPFGYDERFDGLRAPVYLDGYFLNPNLFPARIGQRPCNGSLDEYADIIDRIGSSNSVSIHVRRGDYCQLDEYPVYGLKYVTAAAKMIEARSGAGDYFVFTDDVCWARSEIRLADRRITLVSERTLAAWQDLELMSRCKHNIISNSTFSWWAAFRNANTAKQVVMPGHWHNNFENADVESFALDGWLVI